ncbi:MAG: helicase-associated domain-containing protein, partial [Anaerolineales bacterium]|nr:helicase-associated domain-containing protein [Anaerolineales bacterium]
TRKADLIDQLLIQLSQPGILLKSLLSLGAEHRQVLDALSILHPGIWYKDADVAAVAGHWGELNQYEDVDSYMNDLHETGLVMFGDLDNRYWHRLPFLAGNASRLLPPLLTGRLPTLAPPVSVEKSDAAVRARAFLQRTLRILQMLEQYTPPLRTPMPRPRLEKHYPFLQEWDYLPDEIRAAQVANKIARHDALLRLTVPAPQPVLPDEYAQRLAPIAGGEMELEFIIHLLLTVGLILPGSPVTIWHDNRTQFLRLDENSQWSTLVQSYFSLNRWSELWLLLQQQPELQLERVIRPYHKPVEPAELNGTLRLMRLQLLQLLATLPDDAWYAPADVAALLQLIWPRFDSLSWTRPYYGQKDSQPDWYLAENGQPLDTRADMVAWQKAQGAFLAETICGPLHWLGLADVQLENGRLVAFQLHGLADLFLDKVPTFALPEANGQVAGPITRDDGPDDDILINELTIAVKPAAISAQAHSYLDDIAILETADPDRFVYRLDVTAVHQSLEAGRTLAEMLKQWEKWLSIPVPELIKQQLTAWSDLYGRVRLYEGMSVIEFGDEYALAEMKAATSLADYLVAEISPTLVIVPAAAIELLTAELEKAGYTPKSVAGV